MIRVKTPHNLSAMCLGGVEYLIVQAHCDIEDHELEAAENLGCTYVCAVAEHEPIVNVPDNG